MTTNHKWSMLKCDECNRKDLINKSDLKRHKRFDHKKEVKEDGGDNNKEHIEKKTVKKQKEKKKQNNKPNT